MPWTRGQSFFPSKYAPKCSSRAISCGQPRFKSAPLRTEMYQRGCERNDRDGDLVLHTGQARPHTHTDAITDIHDHLCAAKDHVLIVSAYLDYHGSSRKAT